MSFFKVSTGNTPKALSSGLAGISTWSDGQTFHNGKRATSKNEHQVDLKGERGDTDRSFPVLSLLRHRHRNRVLAY